MQGLKRPRLRGIANGLRSFDDVEVDNLIALALTENDGLTRLVTQLHKHWLYARHPGFTNHDGRAIEQPTGGNAPPRLYGVKIAARL
jgi:hypothetical protein